MIGSCTSTSTSAEVSGAVAYVRGIGPDALRRHPDDFYSTPPQGTQALLNVEPFEGETWEPSCGAGDMSRVLEAAGLPVISSDLVDRGYGLAGVNFLQTTLSVDNVITNPPFKYAQDFVEHALDCADRKVAMLCRLAWLEGGKRRRFFQTTPLARVWVFSRRLTMLRGGWDGGQGGGSMIAFAWYVWDHDHIGEPTLGWLP